MRGQHLIGRDCRGDKSPCWKGGRVIVGGYVEIKNYNHPNADVRGYVRESRLIAEKLLGRILSRIVVIHHTDGKKGMVDPYGIVICENTAYHSLLHRRQRALTICGHVSWRKCQFCKRYDDPVNLFMGGIPTCPRIYHLKCNAKYHLELRKSKQCRKS